MSNWTKTVERYILEGRAVSGGCGASSAQNDIAKEQQQNFSTLTGQAGQVFGAGSQVFKDLTSSFEPILSAGPGQSGFTPGEAATLKSQAITQSGAQYRNASAAAGERAAAAGGGNALLPSGTQAGIQGNIAAAGAENTSNALTNIDLQNAQLGRQNWLSAAGVLSGAPNVFNASTSASGAATTAGSDAMTGATSVNNADNAWVGDVTGILGDASKLGAAAITAGAKQP